ncbi:MAG: hypothetical protein ACOX8R_03370 [Bacillota bacterium]|jgi:hypothetical protein
MKRFGKKTFLIPLLSLFLGLGLLGAAAFAYADDTKSEDRLSAEREIAACVQRGEELYAEMDVLPLELLADRKGTDEINFSDAEKEQLLREKNGLNEAYTGQKAASIRDKAEEVLSFYQKCLSDPAGEPLCIAVKTGVRDMELSDYTVEGDQAQVTASGVVWSLWIEQYEPNGDYYVTMTVNRDTKKYQLAVQEGHWVIEGITDHQKEFPPEEFVPEKARCETLEEAIEAAGSVDTEAELAIADKM